MFLILPLASRLKSGDRPFHLDGDTRTHLKTVVTNSDGRVDGGPILIGDSFRKGTLRAGIPCGRLSAPHRRASCRTCLLDVIPIRFGIADESGHYHVPLLISPYGYSTYRGS